MGKSKDEDSRKRSSPSSRGSEDEGRRKRSKRKEDDTKSKSKKSHRSHKTSNSRSDRDKKSSGKIKLNGRKHYTSSKLNFQELSIDDYFAKNNEFSTWLKRERNVFFSDLSSGSARDLFSEFVKAWNKKELDGQYYDGIAVALRTSHQWNIKK